MSKFISVFSLGLLAFTFGCKSPDYGDNLGTDGANNTDGSSDNGSNGGFGAPAGGNGGGGNTNTDGQTDETDADTDSDSDSDTDADADADSDADADGDADADPGVDPNDVDNDGDGYSENQGDCDDGWYGTYPDAPLWCGDNGDHDCNGLIDATEPDCAEDEPVDPIDPGNDDDVDNDGDGYSENAGDCDDGWFGTFPGAPTYCGDGGDHDCNGLVDDDEECCNPVAVDNDVDNDGHNNVGSGGDDCDDNNASIHPGATELCDGVDQDCLEGIEDEKNECWDTLYRFKSPSSETRCWNVNSVTAPYQCTGYTYEREAFIVAQKSFDGNEPLYSCWAGEDEVYWYDQIFTLDYGDKLDLIADGYTCTQVGYGWEIGDGPVFNPFAKECEVRRYVWNGAAAVGNGHVFTIHDSLLNLIWEDDAFTAVTDQVCF